MSPWYALERCSVCNSVVDKDKKCNECLEIEQKYPGLIPWLLKVITKLLNINNRENSGKSHRVRPKK